MYTLGAGGGGGALHVPTSITFPGAAQKVPHSFPSFHLERNVIAFSVIVH